MAFKYMEELKGDEAILITGGAGFVGRNLVRHLTAHTGHPVVVLDDESLGSRDSIADYEHTFIKADICDKDTLNEALDSVDVVIHLAADTRVMDSIADPVRNFEVNVIGTFYLLNLARQAGIKKIIIASTGGAILGDATPPINEEMVARPLAPYGASKLAAEGYSSAFTGAYGLPITCLRFSNIYGPGSFHKGSVVAHFYKRIMAGEELVVYGDGSQSRDFLFVEDLMAAIVNAMNSDNCGVFQLGSGKATSLNELLEMMQSVTGEDFNSEIKYEDFRAGEVKHTWCNVNKARAELAFSPDTKLEDGLRQTWQWFVDNRALQSSLTT